MELAERVYADAFIVGTSIKRDGVTTNPVDAARAMSFVAKTRSS